MSRLVTWPELPTSFGEQGPGVAGAGAELDDVHALLDVERGDLSVDHDRVGAVRGDAAAVVVGVVAFGDGSGDIGDGGHCSLLRGA
ncbi:hypothetical protein SHIRM173S_12264 [Streptomyces hirsutus]